MKKTGTAHYVAKLGRIEVSVYKSAQPNGSPRYQVANYSTGERRMDSYGSSEAAAKEAAQNLARRLSQHDTKAAMLTENQAIEYVRSTEVLQPFNISVGAASEFVAESIKQVGDIAKAREALKFYAARHKKITDKLVSDVVTELLAKKKQQNKSEPYLADIRSRLQTKFAGKFHCNIGNIITPMIQSWLDSLNCESQQTYKNYRTLLHLLFNFAVKRGYAVDNPVIEVERADIRDTDEVGIYSPADMIKLLNAASPEFLPCLAIGAFAGVRSAEIERLEWSAIDLASKQIVITKGVAKTASRRPVPISENLLEWLNPYAKQQGKVWKGSHDGYYETQQETSVKAQVEWVHNGLRHSYASYRFAQIGDAGRVAGELGNSAAVVHKHYRELVKPADAIKYFNVKPSTPANVLTLTASNV